MTVQDLGPRRPRPPRRAALGRAGRAGAPARQPAGRQPGAAATLECLGGRLRVPHADGRDHRGHRRRGRRSRVDGRGRLGRRGVGAGRRRGRARVRRRGPAGLPRGLRRHRGGAGAGLAVDRPALRARPGPVADGRRAAARASRARSPCPSRRCRAAARPRVLRLRPRAARGLVRGRVGRGARRLVVRRGRRRRTGSGCGSRAEPIRRRGERGAAERGDGARARCRCRRTGSRWCSCNDHPTTGGYPVVGVVVADGPGRLRPAAAGGRGSLFGWC